MMAGKTVQKAERKENHQEVQSTLTVLWQQLQENYERQFLKTANGRQQKKFH